MSSAATAQCAMEWSPFRSLPPVRPDGRRWPVDSPLRQLHNSRRIHHTQGAARIMAVLVTMNWKGITVGQYDAARIIVNWEGDTPAGSMIHTAAFTDSGIRVIDVWESAESFQNFVDRRLMPGLHQLGVSDEPAVEVHELHALFTPGFKPV